MLLSFSQRIHYWITQFKDFRYPATPALPSKPWFSDGDAALTSIPTKRHPESSTFIAYLKRHGTFRIGTGSTKPGGDGLVDGYPLNKAEPKDYRLRITKSIGDLFAWGQGIHVTTGWDSPWGGFVRYRPSMMQEGNPMQRYSDAKLHVYDDVDNDRGPVLSEVQLMIHVGSEAMFSAMQVVQASTDRPSSEARGCSAAQLSLAAHTLRYDDLVRDGWTQRGSMSIKRGRHKFIAPALNSDGPVGKPGGLPDDVEAPPFGIILRLKQSAVDRLRAEGFTEKTNPQAFAVLRCHAGPGLLVVDTSNHHAANLEPDNRWDQKDLAVLQRLTIDDYEVWTL